MRHSKETVMAWVLLVGSMMVMVCGFGWLFVNDYLWFDESGQFFMAKGLSHGSVSYSSEGTLWDALVANRMNNLDPGGFTVLLRWWSEVSNNGIWLRMLPILFYVVGMVCAYKLIAPLVKERLWRVAIVYGVFVLNFVVLLMGPMLRAYSMELCGTMLTLLLLQRKDWRRNVGWTFVLSIVLCFFCTSRYGFLLFAFGVSLYVLKEIGHEGMMSKMERLGRMMLYGVPLLLTVGVIYMVETRYQNASASCPAYVSTLGGRPTFFIIYPLSWVMYAFVYLVWRRKRKSGRLEYEVILFVAAVFVCVSLLNRYPWNMQRAVSLYVPMLLVLLIELYRRFATRSMSMVVVGLVCLVMSVGVYGVMEKFNYRQYHVNKGDALWQLLDYMREEKTKTALVEWWHVPDMRYLYEYGRLKDCAKRDGYPERFVFQRAVERDDVGGETIVEPLFDEVQCDVTLMHEYPGVFHLTGVKLDVKHPEDYERVEGYPLLWKRREK